MARYRKRRKRVYRRRRRRKGAYKLAKLALKRTRAEKKFINKEITDTAGITPITDSLILLSQGTGESDRIGNKITVVSIAIRCLVEMNDSTETTQGRVMVILDRQPNGALATPSEILQDPSGGDSYLSYLNLANRKRFRVIRSMRFRMSNTGRKSQTLSMFRKCRIPMIFSSNNGNVTDIETNNLVLLYQSDAPMGVENSILFKIRIRYIDK